MEKLIITAVVALGLGMFATPFWASKTEAKAPVVAAPVEDPFKDLVATYEDCLAEGTRRAAEQLGARVFLVNIDNGAVETLAVFPKRDWCIAVRNSIRNDSKTPTRWTWDCVDANP